MRGAWFLLGLVDPHVCQIEQHAAHFDAVVDSELLHDVERVARQFGERLIAVADAARPKLRSVSS